MQINFQFETVHGKYCDTLHLPDDHAFTDEEIQTMKQQRLDNWLVFMSMPPQEPNVIDFEAQLVENNAINVEAQLVENNVIDFEAQVVDEVV